MSDIILPIASSSSCSVILSSPWSDAKDQTDTGRGGGASPASGSLTSEGRPVGQEGVGTELRHPRIQRSWATVAMAGQGSSHARHRAGDDRSGENDPAQ